MAYPSRSVTLMPGTWIVWLLSSGTSLERTRADPAYRRMLRLCEAEKGLSPRGRVEAFYGLLNIVDTKAANLLTVDSLLLTFATIPLVVGGNEPSPTLYTILGVTISSMIILILTISIDWDFYAHVRIDEEGREPPDVEPELVALFHVIRVRRWMYQVAWVLSAFAILRVAGVVYERGLGQIN